MRRHLALLLLASAFTFFVGLGRAAIGDADEAFYAEAAREMAESGNWLTPYYNYEERFQKPILYYWLAAATFKITGPGEAAARLPAACAGLALVLITWGCGRRWYDERTALLAGLIAASNFGYFAIGRLALPDLPLAAFMTLSTWAALEAARLEGAGSPGSGDGEGRTRAWLLLASVAAALAMLMKGPVGVALPALTLLVIVRLGLVGPRRWLPVRPGALVLAAGVFLLVAAPWYAAMVQEHGLAYLHRFFIGENVERFATDRYNEPRSLFFYVPVVLGGLAPWSAFLLLWIPGLAAARRRWRGRLSPDAQVMAVWALVPFVFYSLSIGKQPRYILPMLPPLALLLARTLRTQLDDMAAGRSRGRLVSGLAVVSGLLLAVPGLLLLRAAPLLEALSPAATQAAAVLIVLAGLAIGVTGWRRPVRLPVVIPVAAIAAFLSLQYSVFSARGAEPVQRMAAAYNAARTGHEPSGTHRAFVRNLVFYTGVPQSNIVEIADLVTFLEQPTRVLCVLRQRDLDQLAADHQVRPRVLASLRYFNPAALRLRTLVWPDPARDVETVHLVTNR